MRIAIVGAGISGIACAMGLKDHHEVTLYESRDRLGGHAHSVTVEHEGRTIGVDTGFIVYNERNYPRLTRFFRDLGVETKDAPMTFGVRDDRSGICYGGENLNTLFAQRRNLLNPRFWRLIRDARRFFREAADAIEHEHDDATLGAFLDAHGYSRDVAELFLIPMGGAIWSSSDAQMRGFPLRFFVRFFDNHGMLTLRDRPRWRTVVGGSRRYVDAARQRLGDRVRLSSPVRSVVRGTEGVTLTTDAGEERYDEVVLACHSDQALAVLGDASGAEREILGAIPYQSNDTVLHTDPSLMPGVRRAWSAWNARRTTEGRDRAVVTYDLTILQSLETREHLLVSLNQTEDIDPTKVLMRTTYDHPLYTIEGERAKARYGEIGGVRRTHFAGAYWFNGFHEDGMRSAERVCAHLGVSL